MRRFLLTTVISIIVLMVCMGAWVFGQEHRRQITVVGDVAYPPFEYRDEYGKVCGISVDLWKLWGQKTGVEVRYLLYDWNDAIELVRRGEADAVGGIFLRDDPSLSFSNPYLRLNVRIISSDGISQINTTEDMKGFQVGVVRGDFMEKYLQKMAPDVPLVLAPNFESLVKMAIDGQVKVFVCDEPVAKFLLAKHGTLEQFAFSNDPLRVDLLRAGVNVKDQALLKLVNEGFSRITHEEKMEVLLRWTGHRVVPPSRWKLLAGVFLFCLAILAGVMVWNWQLRRNVAKATTVLTNKQDEFEAIFQAMPDMFFLVDEKGRYLEFRGGAQSRPLVPPELFLGKTISQVMPHEAAERLQVALELAGQRREVVNLEYELEEVDQRRNYDARIAPLGDSQFVCLVRDITEQKNCEQEQAMAAQVIENAIEGIIVADENGIVLMANPACKAITGYQTEELIGGQLDILRSENDSLDLYAKVWAALTENGQWSGEYWNRRKNGEAYPEWLTLTLIRDSQDRIAYYLAIFYDITEIKQSQEQLKYQAYHDALTGLPNRILLQDRLGHAIQHTRREGGRVGVLFIDLDNFKSVNDSLGHDMGDIVLKQVTARLRDCLREQDTVARVGGDEFVMVLEAVESESGAVRVGRRVLERLSSEFDLPGHVIKISASIGIALYPDDGRSVDTLIKNADLAMYRAKEKGKNNYQLFTPALQDSAQRRMVLEGALRQALEDRQFEVHYQPWFNLAVDRILGVEALLRWIHPERGCLNPGEFIGLAEETGLIVPIGEWVLAEACGQAKSWIASNPDLKISINLSVMQLLQENLASAVKQALSDTGLPPGNLELEIIENAVIRNEQKAAESLQALSALGVRLTFDDYGAGNSSLSCLKHLPIDLIKIDRSFTDRIAAQENDAAIVKSIIELGRNLRITIVAKGVETPEQLAVLREIGCEGVQGFLLGRPVPASELEKLLI